MLQRNSRFLHSTGVNSKTGIAQMPRQRASWGFIHQLTIDTSQVSSSAGALTGHSRKWGVPTASSTLAPQGQIGRFWLAEMPSVESDVILPRLGLAFSLHLTKSCCRSCACALTTRPLRPLQPTSTQSTRIYIRIRPSVFGLGRPIVTVMQPA